MLIEIEVTASFLLLPIIKPLICLFNVLLPNILYQCSRLPDLLINSLIFLIGSIKLLSPRTQKIIIKRKKIWECFFPTILPEVNVSQYYFANLISQSSICYAHLHFLDYSKFEHTACIYWHLNFLIHDFLFK